MKKDKISAAELFSIPNILGYFRILMLPVFLVKYSQAKTKEDFLLTFLLLAVIFLTDALDGYIARRFHMVTDLGKILDPVSDKLVQGALAVAVTFRYSWMKVFLLVFLIKELYMACMGLYLIKARNRLNGAKWYGKVCTAFVDVGVLSLLFLPNLPKQIGNGIICLMIAVELFSVIAYIGFHRKELKRKMK
ncbi:MAG: CDP-alcohol phosphatidyltransferase family protein [Fusicatenibacter sp.]|nr:CDP-alcohol phosphatidyltransferase family protein [Lachnospiraceae bacterium]MDY2939232.1 CDP-alcohol phosphatidyltransferase family protein [Fusicatenibacter sp.]